MSIDYHNVQQLEGLYDQLSKIREILNSLLDDEAGVMFRFYKAVAECKIKSSLGEKGMLSELIANGKDELVKEYIETEKEVQKAKNSFRQALEAINLKKHINNISPK